VTATGTPIRLPSSSGVLEGVPMITTPPSTRPMNKMKKPMPMAIAFFNCSGMALKMAVRRRSARGS